MTCAPIFSWDSKPRRSGPVVIRIVGHRRLDLRDITGQLRTVDPGDVIVIDGAGLEFLERPDFEIVEDEAP